VAPPASASAATVATTLKEKGRTGKSRTAGKAGKQQGSEEGAGHVMLTRVVGEVTASGLLASVLLRFPIATVP